MAPLVRLGGPAVRLRIRGRLDVYCSYVRAWCTSGESAHLPGGGSGKNDIVADGLTTSGR
jgi:hypothetical protein